MGSPLPAYAVIDPDLRNRYSMRHDMSFPARTAATHPPARTAATHPTFSGLDVFLYGPGIGLQPNPNARNVNFGTTTTQPPGVSGNRNDGNGPPPPNQYGACRRDNPGDGRPPDRGGGDGGP